MRTVTYEKSLFAKYLGDSPYIRVLDYFIANDIYDCSLQDVADATQLSRKTAPKAVELAKVKRVHGRCEAICDVIYYVSAHLELERFLRKKYNKGKIRNAPH